MAMTAETAKADPQRGRYWLMFLSGPITYGLYFLVVYVLSEFGCLAGYQRFPIFGTDLIRFGVVALTAIFTLIMIAFTVVAYRRWDRFHSGKEAPDDDAPSFILFVGTWLNGIFAFVTVATAVPVLLGSACNWI
jgi:cbb3-type cytochrome oxidase subunit 3